MSTKEVRPTLPRPTLPRPIEIGNNQQQLHLGYLAERQLADIASQSQWTNESLVVLAHRLWWLIGLVLMMTTITACNMISIVVLLVTNYGLLDKVSGFISLLL